MNGQSKPFQRCCAWCGDLFKAKSSENFCCLGCSQELYQATQELYFKQVEFREVRDKVSVLHERLCRIHLRVERQVKKLRRLGVRWREAENDEGKSKVEKRERRTARMLRRLNNLCEKRNKEAIPFERELAVIEAEINRLQKIVGDNSSNDE